MYSVNILNDEEYRNKMMELGLIEDKKYGKFFLGDMAFLMNVGDNINEVGDLIKFSGDHLNYLSQSLVDFSRRGGELVIGPGTIDEYGVKYQKALYCTNYREIYSEENVRKNK